MLEQPEKESPCDECRPVVQMMRHVSEDMVISTGANGTAGRRQGLSYSFLLEGALQAPPEHPCLVRLIRWCSLYTCQSHADYTLRWVLLSFRRRM